MAPAACCCARSRGSRAGACFKVISDLQPDPGTITDPFPAQDPEDPFNVLTEAYNEKHWAYSTYTPPQNFVNTQDKEREVEVEIAFTPKNPFSKDYTFTLPIKTREKVKVRRPPVILVHGIWSGKQIWPTSFTAPDPQDGWKIERIDYPNSSHFKGSATTLQKEINRMVEGSRKSEIATTKADVIAHSMGGLVSRAFISDANMYLRPNNFKEGDIRKLITLDTPHQGSQLANLLVSIHDSFPHAKLAGLESRITGPSGNFHEGALCDLAENSQGIGLGAISGNILARAYNSTGGAYSSSGSLTFPLGILTRIYTSDYFFNSYIGYYGFRVSNDAIVTHDSQQHGLPGYNFPTLVHSKIPFNLHAAVTADSVVAQAAYVDLDTVGLSVTGFVSAIGKTEGNGTGVPTTAGIGDGNDATHYDRQCLPGGPMNISMTIAAAATAAIIKAASIVPGVTITAPVDGTVVRPGDTITVRVDVDTSLNPSSVLIGDFSGAGMALVEDTTPPYETTLTVPMDWAGPIELGIDVKTTNDDIVGPSSVFINVVPQEAPARIAFLNDHKGIDTEPAVPPQMRSLTLNAYYAGGIRRDVSHPSLGTTYISSNPAVAAISPEGVLTPVAQGMTFITATFRGLKAYARIIVGDQIAVAAIPIDHTSVVSIVGGGFLFDRASGQYVQQVKITNQSALPLPKPLDLILTGLPSGVKLAEAKGVTKNVAPLGSPRVYVSGFDGPFLPPGQSVTLTLRFFNYNNQSITYTPKLYTGNRL
jgi:pimeloyl-ACP methyl ester carboxylesterase